MDDSKKTKSGLLNESLLQAVTERFLPGIETALHKGAELNHVSKSGVTALTLAASYEDGAETVAYLVDLGADMNQRNGNGNTALTLAATYGLTATLDVLIEKGADITMRDAAGLSAENLAHYYRHTECFYLLGQAAARQKENADKKELREWAAKEALKGPPLEWKVVQLEKTVEELKAQIAEITTSQKKAETVAPAAPHNVITVKF